MGGPQAEVDLQLVAAGDRNRGRPASVVSTTLDSWNWLITVMPGTTVVFSHPNL